jgi:hypothetical protein
MTVDDITPQLISNCLGPYGPIENVRTNWPLVVAALSKHSLLDIPTCIAAIATIAVETGNFSPIKERGGPAYFTKLYENRADLGNTQPGDGPLFRGRGFVQITGRANYTAYGRAMGVDLAGTPDRALEPGIAAEILVLYFRDHNIPGAAALGKWETVRRRVNGGLNGWDRFSKYVDALTQALAFVPAPATPAPAPTEQT